MGTDFLYEDADVVAFADIDPQAPVHVLIVPRSHKRDITEVSPELLEKLFHAGNILAGKLELDQFRYVVNTGKDAGQTVFHVHIHLLGGRTFHWPPG